MPSYIVTTEQFGDVSVTFDNIGQARADARERFGVTNPRMVRVAQSYVKCDSCESAPCTCASKESTFEKRRYAAVVTAHARVDAALALVDCDMVDAACDTNEEPEFRAACAAIKALRVKLARRL
jgi:hypothetical protein